MWDSERELAMPDSDLKCLGCAARKRMGEMGTQELADPQKPEAQDCLALVKLRVQISRF